MSDLTEPEIDYFKCKCGHSKLSHKGVQSVDKSGEVTAYWGECLVNDCKCKFFRVNRELKSKPTKENRNDSQKSNLSG